MKTNNTRPIQDVREAATDLYRLAYLLTGQPDLSIDIAADTVALARKDSRQVSLDWWRAWSKRIAIGKALAAIDAELRKSAQRTEALTDADGKTPMALPQREFTQDQLEEALLAIDSFPRAALLLLIFERVPVEEAVILLDVDSAIIRAAQVIGLRELMANLARMVGRQAPGGG